MDVTLISNPIFVKHSTF